MEHSRKGWIRSFIMCVCGEHTAIPQLRSQLLLRKVFAFFLEIVVILIVLTTSPMAVFAEPFHDEEQVIGPLDCGFQHPDKVIGAFRAPVAAGRIPDPRTRVLPAVRLRTERGSVASAGSPPAVTQYDLFLFEDRVVLLSRY